MQLSAVNPTDWKSRAGATPRAVDGFQIPHHDGAGVIDAVGAGVDPGRVGERVWTWLAAAGSRYGTAAQWCVLPSRQAVPLPENASAELGACLGVPGHDRALVPVRRRPGRPARTSSSPAAPAPSGISRSSWPSHSGARVATTVSGPEKAELARQAGADLIVNYRDAGAAAQLQAFAPRMDRIVELALGANLELDLSVSGPGTHIVDLRSAAAGPGSPGAQVHECQRHAALPAAVQHPGAGGRRLRSRRSSAAAAAGALTPAADHQVPARPGRGGPRGGRGRRCRQGRARDSLTHRSRAAGIFAAENGWHGAG